MRSSGWKLFTAAAISRRYEYSDCPVERFISQFRGAIIRPRCEKSIGGTRSRHRSPLSFKIARHPANKISRSNLFMERHGGIYFHCTSPSIVAQSAIGLMLFIAKCAFVNDSPPSGEPFCSFDPLFR